MTDFNPSNCEILDATISNHDNNSATSIVSLIGRATFTQSISMPAWLGSVVVFDNTGLLENFPLRGEEDLDLTLKSLDLNYEVFLKAKIYKIDGMSSLPGGNGVMYTLHFASKSSYNSSKRKIITSFKDDSASNIVSKLFKKYAAQITPNTSNDEVLPYSTKKYNLLGDHNTGRHLYVQPTSGQLKAIIPNYIFSTAMNFIAGKSYSTSSESCSYRFFETFNDYHFVTDEFLIKRGVDNKESIVNLYYDSFISLDPNKAIDQITTIEKLDNPTRVNVTNDIHGGGYVNKIIEIDFVRRKVNENIFDYSKDAKYIDTTGKQTKLSSDIHSESFIKDTFNTENAMRVLVYKDYCQEGDISGTLRANQFYSEIISRRISQQHHMNNIAINIGIRGRLDIAAGNIININASKFTGNQNKESNQQISGNYLVHTIEHEIDKGILRTSAKLIKYDWSTV